MWSIASPLPPGHPSRPRAHIHYVVTQRIREAGPQAPATPYHVHCRHRAVDARRQIHPCRCPPLASAARKAASHPADNEVGEMIHPQNRTRAPRRPRRHSYTHSTCRLGTSARKRARRTLAEKRPRRVKPTVAWRCDPRDPILPTPSDRAASALSSPVVASLPPGYPPAHPLRSAAWTDGRTLHWPCACSVVVDLPCSPPQIPFSRWAQCQR